MFVILDGHGDLYVLFFLLEGLNQYRLCKVFCLACWHARINPEWLEQPPGIDPVRKGQVFTLEAIGEFGNTYNAGSDIQYYRCTTHVSAEDLNGWCMQADRERAESLRALNNLRKKMGILREEGSTAQAELEI